MHNRRTLIPKVRPDQFRVSMLTGERCFMGAPLGDEHRCHGTVTDDQADYLCSTCQAATDGTGPTCTCAGCSLEFGPDS